MSADNYYVVKRHPAGGFTYVQGFASDDDDVALPVPTDQYPSWPTVEKALLAAINDYSEYGASLDDECAAILAGES